MPDEELLSEQLEQWLGSDQPKTIGGLVELFEEKSFAVLFVVLLAIPALPLPTGGVTHVFEVIAMLLALELIIGRRHVWLPDRWLRRELPEGIEKQGAVLIRRIRWVERHSMARLGALLSSRISSIVFGVIVLGLTVTAFLAPPFTGLDTLPSLGVVVISLGVLFEDALLALIGLIIGAAGVLLVIVLGRAAVHEVSSLF